MTELEELQAIIDNAPDMLGIEYDELLYCEKYGSCYYLYVNESNVFVYNSNNKSWRDDSKGNYPISEFWTIRSLSDIKRIIELLKENK